MISVWCIAIALGLECPGPEYGYLELRRPHSVHGQPSDDPVPQTTTYVRISDSGGSTLYGWTGQLFSVTPGAQPGHCMV